MYPESPTLDFTKSMFILDRKVQVLSPVMNVWLGIDYSRIRDDLIIKLKLAAFLLRTPIYSNFRALYITFAWTTILPNFYCSLATMHVSIWLLTFPLLSLACNANYVEWTPRTGQTLYQDVLPIFPDISLEGFKSESPLRKSSTTI
jgi:hypothetical protein